MVKNKKSLHMVIEQNIFLIDYHKHLIEQLEQVNINLNKKMSCEEEEDHSVKNVTGSEKVMELEEEKEEAPGI
jgi:chaperonin GroEL (HSP60 family)